jgi:esterase/lipase superfamily enzyme
MQRSADVRAALVVAHPDDEVLWGAGWIITHPEDSFAVWCCSTPRIDPKRADQFFDVVEVLDAGGVVLTGGDHPKRPLDLTGLDGALDNYDYVVTHNHQGEYGNEHHKQVHRYVVENFKGPVVMFGRGLPAEEAYCITLTTEQLGTKLIALQSYSHIARTDRCPKWRALLERYFNNDLTRFGEETYVRFR